MLLLPAAALAGAFPGANGRIAFTCNYFGNDEICTVNPDGSDLRRLTQTDTNVSDSNPAWSPDAQRITFVSTRSGAADIWVMNADGSGPVNLTNSAENDDDPTWSNAGTHIAYFRNAQAAEESGIYTVPAGGGTPQPFALRGSAASAPSTPSYSSTGTVAWKFISPPTPTSHGVIFTGASAPGTQLTPADPFGDTDPTWSPDGSRIAYVDAPAQLVASEIYTIPAGGGAETNLTNSGGVAEATPTWSPDGTQIAYIRQGNLFRIPADGGTAVEIPTVDVVSRDAAEPDWARASGDPGPGPGDGGGDGGDGTGGGGPGQGGGTTPPLDVNAPNGSLGGKTTVTLGNSVAITVTSDEACTAVATGSLTIPRAGRATAAKRFALRRATKSIPAGGKVTLRLRIPKRARGPATKAIKQGKRVRAQVRVVMSDAAGNEDTLRRSIRFKASRKR